MKIAIIVYEYGRGERCVYMFKYTYAGIREMDLQMSKESRHISRVMRTSIGTVTQVSIKFVDKENENMKVVMDQNTKHAARARQVERQVEKKTYTHDTDL